MKPNIFLVDYRSIPTDILLEADPSIEKIRKYLKDSYCYISKVDDDIAGAFVLLPRGNTIELMNIVVKDTYKRHRIGSHMLKFAIEECKRLNFSSIFVGTGTFGYQLTFYQKVGFRVDSIIKDFFLDNYSDDIYEFGVQHRDMLVLKYKIK